MLPTIAAALLIAAVQVVQVTGTDTQQVPSKQPTGYCSKCDKPCGTQPEQDVASTKIVGGEDARENEFPWLATLWENGFFSCGSSLITKKHALTAAHCVEKLTPENLTVTIGEYDLFLDNCRKSMHTVAQIHYHQDYNQTTVDNDIAIIELVEPVLNDNPWVRFACLPKSADTSYDGIMATVVGWGKLGEKEKLSNILQKVDVPIISNADCKNMGYPPKLITSNMICAGYKEGQKDACENDSGGPLHRHIDSSDTMEVIGIVSFGKGCARKNYPGVYTRVANYLDWIMDQTGNECICGAESS